MIFGPTKLAEAEGAILAHSVSAGAARFKKGRVLSAEDVAALSDAGVAEVIAARLEPTDMGEDEAAARIAAAAAGPGLTASAPFTGRCNLFAETAGLVRFTPERVDRLNMTDPAITIATLSNNTPVAARDMVATIKIIPFAAPADAAEQCAAIAVEDGGLIALHPFRALRAGMVLTATPGMKGSILDKTVEVTRRRIESLSGTLSDQAVIRCAHDEGEVTAAIGRLLRSGCEILLLSGASAIVDVRDVLPAAIVAAGGTVDHFGMPVDPGNLLLLGHHGTVPVIGLPGCARSPKLNGIDWLLERVYAGLTPSAKDIMGMGIGGLLKETSARPMPRADKADKSAGTNHARAPRIAALLLAAGQSRRMGAVNKLLADIGGAPMVARVVDTLCGSGANPIIVVTGHEAERVRMALDGRGIEWVHNPDYAGGLSTSLKAGLAALPADIDGVLIALGDMPDVAPAHIDRLIAAFDPAEGREICVPTFNGKRGNPVLWGKRFFEDMAHVSGDVGARHLIGEYGELVCEVPMPTAGILTDLDTPEALAAHAAPPPREA